MWSGRFFRFSLRLMLNFDRETNHVWGSGPHTDTFTHSTLFFFFIFTTLNFLLFTNLVLPLHVFMSLLFFGLGSKPPDKTFTLTLMSTVVFEIAPLNFNSHVSFVVAFSLNMIIIDSGFQCMVFSFMCVTEDGTGLTLLLLGGRVGRRERWCRRVSGDTNTPAESTAPHLTWRTCPVDFRTPSHREGEKWASVDMINLREIKHTVFTLCPEVALKCFWRNLDLVAPSV